MGCHSVFAVRYPTTGAEGCDSLEKSDIGIPPVPPLGTWIPFFASERVTLTLCAFFVSEGLPSNFNFSFRVTPNFFVFEDPCASPPFFALNLLPSVPRYVFSATLPSPRY